MKTKTVIQSLLGFGVLAGWLQLLGPSTALAVESRDSLRRLAQQAVGSNARIAETAIRALRAQGPSGLEALIETHSTILQAWDHDPEHAEQMNPELWKRLKAAFEAVGQQRDCHVSRLYWFTNMAEAKAEAQARRLPILSLHLLGRLDHEYSCANSRFMRTLLYANAAVSQYLRQHFVLHWHSVAAVPKLTIDFGDGRTLERTITGNSVHYILDSAGNPVDVLPGLYGPAPFLRALKRAQPIALECSGLSGHARALALQQYHRSASQALQAEWEKHGGKTGALPQDESELTSSLSPDQAQFDKSSLGLIRSQNPTALAASARALSKAVIENPFLLLIRNLARSVTQDTIFNEFVLRPKIHQWFIAGTSLNQDLQQLNEQVYADLFLMPLSDPWFGLIRPDAFTALDYDGHATARKNRR